MSPGWLFARVAAPFLAGYFVSYVYRMVNAVLAPTLAAEFGLSAGGLGLLSSVYFLSFGLFQLPLGLLLDRFGPRRVNATLLLVAAAGGAWFALAGSAPSAIAARALIGIGVSGCLMASFTAFVLWYPPDRISTMNGLAFSAGMLGAMAATVPLELLLRVWHWREAFFLIAGTTVAVSAVFWLWVPDPRSARPRGETLAEQWRGLREVIADPGFLRLAVCLGATQFAAVALQTLWIATWLRDVAGYDRAGVGQALLVVNLALIAGFLAFGRLADARTRRGASALPVVAGGVALAAACLGLLAAGVTTGALVLWGAFVFFGTAATLGYSIVSRRFPKELAGRVNTTLNTFIFTGMFLAQWLVGLVLEGWPRSNGGYPREAYSWALGMLCAAQLAGLAWFWSGRRLLDEKKPAPYWR